MQQVVQLGQTAQPSVLQQLESAKRALSCWLSAKSPSFSSIAGEDVSRLDVVKAHLYLAFVFAVMFIVSNMGGVIS